MSLDSSGNAKFSNRSRVVRRWSARGLIAGAAVGSVVCANAVAAMAVPSATAPASSKVLSKPVSSKPVSSKPVASKPVAGKVAGGKVVVVLRDQLPGLSAKSAQRTDRALAEQRAVLAGLPGSAPSAIEHFSVGNAFAATVTSAQAAALAADPGVASVTPDVSVSVGASAASVSTAKNGKSASPKTASPKTATPKTATPKATAPESNALCPTDPAKPLLEPEALSTIHAASADGAANAQQLATGAGVKVAFLAEGMDPNAADYLRPDGTSAVVDSKDFVGQSAIFGTAYGDEAFGDASMIAAQGTVVHDLSTFVNPAHPLPKGCNIQIRGVAPGASLVNLKVLSAGSGIGVLLSPFTPLSAILQAINYAVSVDHVDVLSESVGLNGFPDAGAKVAFTLFNDQAVAAGVTVVAATGDAGTTNTVVSPAADPNVISAAGSTTNRVAMQVGAPGVTLSNHHWINGNIAAFSSGGFTQSGTVPTLTAPGDLGWAACSSSAVPGCTDENGKPSAIEAFGGTSMSTPIIAGTAALVIEAYRNTHRGASPSPAQIKTLLTSTATDLGAPATEQGAGQVDALSAVRAAMRAGTPTAAGKRVSSAGAALALSTGQLTDQGVAGAAQQNTITVTNTGTHAVTLAPSVRQLATIGQLQTQTLTLSSADPTLPNQAGATYYYQKTTFDVAKNADRFALSLAYPGQAATFGGPRVRVTLLAPDGSYVTQTYPQGDGNYGNVDVSRPAAGTWTAIVGSSATADLFGSGIPPYQGTVQVQVQQQHWVVAGQVRPARVSIGPGQHQSLIVTSRLPLRGGDSSLTVALGAAGQSATVPITQRVLVSAAATSNGFSGGITGGNGRGGAPAQTFTYAVDVPAGHHDLDVGTTLHSTATTGFAVALIDPHGEVASYNDNDVINSQPVTGSAVDNVVADPIAGRWRIVVYAHGVVDGNVLVIPFTGTVGLDNVRVDASALPNTATTILPAGHPTTVNVQVTDTGVSTFKLETDPRTRTTQALDLTPISGNPTEHMPYLGFAALLAPTYLVPPQTSKLTFSATADVPVMVQAQNVYASNELSGITLAGQPAAAGQPSTATLSESSGYVTRGQWTPAPAEVGPFGPSGAPAGTATMSATATTLGFDNSVTSPTGDAYASGDISGSIDVKPGATATIPVTITPTAAPGTVVTGYLNIIDQQDLSDQVIATIPYAYTVGAAAAASAR